MRVCLDTSVLVAAFATRGLCADVLRTVLAGHDLVIGAVMFGELRRTLTTKLKVPADRVEAVEAVLGVVPVLPRPDEPGAADVLVSGDRDLLLDVAADAPLPILAPRAFWELLRAEGP